MIFKQNSVLLATIFFSYSLLGMSKNAQILKAVKKGDKYAVLQLHQSGANIMLRNKDGQNILLKEAISKGSPDMVDILLNMGIDPYSITIQRTPHFDYCPWEKDICICPYIWADIKQRIKHEIKKRDKRRQVPEFKGKLPRHKGHKLK